MLPTLFRLKEILWLAVITLLLCASNSSYAQSKINGSVVDANNQPLADATVLLLKTKDSSLVKGTTTARNGQYSFTNITAGSYWVVSSFYKL
ncbi:MAG: carboxypeptidase-like regulatory domain-containing protein [Bacteroidota bacterium]